LRNFAVNKSSCLRSKTQWGKDISDGVFLFDFCHKNQSILQSFIR
jgi:hypothetical protein